MPLGRSARLIGHQRALCPNEFLPAAPVVQAFRGLRTIDEIARLLR